MISSYFERVQRVQRVQTTRVQQGDFAHVAHVAKLLIQKAERVQTSVQKIGAILVVSLHTFFLHTLFARNILISNAERVQKTSAKKRVQNRGATSPKGDRCCHTPRQASPPHAFALC